MRRKPRGKERRMSKAKKIWIGSALAAASFAAAVTVSHVITDGLVRVALHREEPKTMTRVKQKWEATPKAKEKMEYRRRKAQELESKVSEELEIISHDGETLIGHWYPCENAQRVIIAMHGWRSSWSKDFGGVAKANLWRTDYGGKR